MATAAELLGWGVPVGGDECNYVGPPDPLLWSVYNGPGHAQNGVRSPARVTVDGEKMILTGLAGSANTAGLMHKMRRQYGRYGWRARSFYTTDPTAPGNKDGGYHPVVTIWPSKPLKTDGSGDVVSWPRGGEYDPMENGEPGQPYAGCFHHHPSLDGDDHKQQAPNFPVDLREWNVFEFEWAPTGLTGWVNGVEWYTMAGGAASDRLAIQAMEEGRLTLQLDAFQSSGLIASTMQIDWVRIYGLTPVGSSGGTGGGTGSGGSTGQAVAAPTNHQVTYNTTTRVATSTWTVAPGADATEVHEFLVDPASTLKATVTAPGSSRSSGTLAGGRDYLYAVRSVDAGQTSGWSDRIRIRADGTIVNEGGGTTDGGGAGGGTGTGALVVSAGPSAAVAPGGTFTRVATTTGTGTVATWAWTITAVPAGGPAGLLGTTVGAAAAVTWPVPAVQGVYRLTVTARDSAGALLGSAFVDVEVTSDPATGGTHIDIVPDPIVEHDAFGIPVFETAASTVPEVPIYPGPATYPGGDTFPGTTVDLRYRRPRRGWTLYPGPTTFPGPALWPGWGRTDQPLPPFDVEVFLLDPGGGYRCALPDLAGFDLTRVADDPGSVSISYPTAGRNFDRLREHVDAGADAMIAVRVAGSFEWELEALLADHTGDEVAEGAVWSFSGAWSEILLAETAVVSPTGDGKIGFESVTPGGIVAELAVQAQARGGFDVDCSTFSAEYDSTGAPWPADTITSPTFAESDSSTMLWVLQLLAGAGVVEFEMRRGRSLRLYVPGGRGRDLTVGTQLVLQAGRDLQEASRRTAVRGAVTALRVLGADGEALWVSDDTALGRRGRRIEGTVSQGGLRGGALRAWGQAKLAASTSGAVERVHRVRVGDEHPLPLRDLDVGDTAWSDSDGVRRRLRVAQWTLSRSEQGDSASTSLGDLIAQPLLRLARKLLGIGDGTAVLGGTTAPSTEALTPAAPTGLVLDSVTSNRWDGAAEATLLARWDPVVTAADGTSGVTVTGYRLRWRQIAVSPAGVSMASDWAHVEDIVGTSVQVEGLIPATQVEAQVAAYAIDTTTGSLTPPDVPDIPTTPDTPTTPDPGGGGGGGGGTPDPSAQYPADVVDLTRWKITLPVVEGGRVKEVKPPELATYSDQYFRLTDAKDGILFTVFHGGGTTANSSNPRSELRERVGDDPEGYWDATEGTHALTVTGMVTRLTKVKPHVVLWQIHGGQDDLTVFRLEGTRLYITRGDDTHTHLVTSSFALNQRYVLKGECRNGTMTYWFNGAQISYTQRLTDDSAYFKCGNYLQSNPDSAPGESTSEYSQVIIYAIEVAHS